MARRPVLPLETVAYRGYLIQYNPFSGARWIECGGAHIAYVKDENHARRLIDSLLD